MGGMLPVACLVFFFSLVIAQKSYGPYGGNGGSPFDDGADPAGIRQIRLFASTIGPQRLLGMRTHYRGATTPSVVHGDGYISTRTVIVLNFDKDEYIIKLDIVTGPSPNAANVVNGLTFYTTNTRTGAKRTVGTNWGWNPSTDKKWTPDNKGSTITGFWGRSATVIDQLGIYTGPPPSPPPLPSPPPPSPPPPSPSPPPPSPSPPPPSPPPPSPPPPSSPPPPPSPPPPSPPPPSPPPPSPSPPPPSPPPPSPPPPSPPPPSPSPPLPSPPPPSPPPPSPSPPPPSPSPPPPPSQCKPYQRCGLDQTCCCTGTCGRFVCCSSGYICNAGTCKIGTFFADL